MPGEGGALHERLADALAALVEQGQLGPGDRLPTHRELAKRAGVAIGTVTKAVDLLTRRGIVRGEVGRGTFITPASEVRSSETIDLTLNIPPLVIDPQLFLEASDKAARKVLTLPSAGLYDLIGTREQRLTVAKWLTQTRLDIDAASLFLCVGAQQAIHLSFADLRRFSPVIACEPATFSGAIAAASHLGMKWAPVAYDEEGMIPDALDTVLGKTGCKAIYATHVCHNPMGFEVGEIRRHKVLDVCRKHDAFIVEDDIYGIYSTENRLTYKALDPERVYYLTSLSKCLSPLVRMGILAPPNDRMGKLTRDLRAQVFGASPTSLELGCALIELGADRIAATKLRDEAAIRVNLAARHLGIDALPMPEGAPHIWLPMAASKAEKLVRRASDRGIRLTPPDATSIDGDRSAGVRLCVLAPEDRNDLERALRTVADLLDAPDEMVV